jgi:hypothetical protein
VGAERAPLGINFVPTLSDMRGCRASGSATWSTMTLSASCANAASLTACNPSTGPVHSVEVAQRNVEGLHHMPRMDMKTSWQASWQDGSMLHACMLAICREGLSDPNSSGIVSHVTTFTAGTAHRYCMRT